MAAKSTNKHDVYEWIEKVIDSCTTYFHFKSVNNLISNFYNKYDDWQLTGKLRGYANNKHTNKKYK